MEPYLPLLYRLNERGVKYVVIGTGALWLHLSEFRSRPLSDCDLFLPSNDYANLTQAVNALAAENWHATVWGEAVTLPLTENQLSGKFYLRCNKFVSSPAPNLLVADISYECGWPTAYGAAAADQPPPLGLTFDAMNSERVMIAPPNAKIAAAAKGDTKSQPSATATATAASGVAAAAVAPAAASLIPTASIEHVLALKRIRNRARDRLTIVEVEGLVGPFRRTTGKPPPANLDASADIDTDTARGVNLSSVSSDATPVLSAMAQTRAANEFARHATAQRRRTAWYGEWTQFEVLFLAIIVLCLLRFGFEMYHTRFHIRPPANYRPAE